MICGLNRSILSVLVAAALAASNSAFVVTGFVPAKSSSPVSKTTPLAPAYRTPRQAAERGRDPRRCGPSTVEAIGAGGAQQRRKPTRHFAWPISRDPTGVTSDYPLTITRIAITVASCYLTWYAQTQYSNVMASAAVTLVCSMVFDKRLGQAAFCGSFAGMCSQAVIPTRNLALALGGITSLLYEIFIHAQNAFLGVGGRLGATAFLATSAVAYKTGVKTGLGRLTLFGGTRALKLSALRWESTIAPFAFWHAVGAVATIVLREVSDDSAAADPVRASAVVGLAGALLLPNDAAAALAVYGGTFVGMSLPSKLMGLSALDLSHRLFTLGNVVSLLLAFALSGALSGIVHGATIDWKLWQGGWGGKAGMCAFVGCMTYRSVTTLLGKLTREKR